MIARSPNLFTLLMLVLLTVNYLAPFADYDFAWHVRTGEGIARTGQLHVVDSFTYTIADKPLPDFEWLYEVVVWAAWATASYPGLRVLKILLIASPLVLLGWRLRHQGVPWYATALAILISACVLSSFWNLRPMLCTTLGLLLVSGWLHDHCTGQRKLCLAIVPTMLIWGNLHPGVIMGQALILGSIACEWLNQWLLVNPPLDKLQCGRLTCVGGLGLAASFVSPDPIDRLLYPFSAAIAHPIQRSFLEMKPAYVFLLEPRWEIWLAFVVVILIGLACLVSFRECRLWELALLSSLGLLASTAVRSVPDCLLVTLALGLPHVGGCLGRLQKLRARASRGSCFFRLSGALIEVDRISKRAFGHRWLRPQPGWLALAGVLLILVSFLPAVGQAPVLRAMRDAPVTALDWIESQGLEGHFFTVPNYGAYVGWRLGNRAKVYVDTRGFFFPPELLEDSLLVPQMAGDWRRRLERVLSRETDYFLLESGGSRGRLWQELRRLGATPVYCDEQAVLLGADQVRDALANSGKSNPGRNGAATISEDPGSEVSHQGS
jgi:hypothetical protein